MKMKAGTVHGENHAPFIKCNSRIVPEMFQKYHIMIIGGGPAGLNAGLYAARKGWKTAMIKNHEWRNNVNINIDSAARDHIIKKTKTRSITLDVEERSGGG